MQLSLVANRELVAILTVPRKDKLITRLRDRPKDYTWDEACTVMKACGFALLKRSGSRRRFVHEVTRVKVFIHEPHPQPTLKAYAIDDLITGLKNAGEIE